MPEFFGPFSRSAFLVNKKSLFLQKCQCIELLTVFRLLIYLPPLPTSDFQMRPSLKYIDIRIGVPICVSDITLAKSIQIISG